MCGVFICVTLLLKLIKVTGVTDVRKAYPKAAKIVKGKSFLKRFCLTNFQYCILPVIRNIDLCWIYFFINLDLDELF
jgi:hypothetical protein